MYKPYLTIMSEIAITTLVMSGKSTLRLFSIGTICGITNLIKAIVKTNENIAMTTGYVIAERHFLTKASFFSKISFDHSMLCGRLPDISPCRKSDITTADT